MYTISKVADKRLYKIEREGMPDFYARSWQDAGRELASLEIDEKQLEFQTGNPLDRHMILAFMHANWVLNRSKKNVASLEKRL